MRYKKHVFICCNQKANGKSCCGEERGLALLQEMKKIALEKGIGKEIRIQKSGCLDACSFGPSMVVYPEGNYYGNVQLQDLEFIIESDLLNNKPLENLLIDFNKQK